MQNYDLANLTLQAMAPNNTILLDNKGLPSVMVKIPKFKISDVIPGGADKTHPAFIVNGVEKEYIYISKYQNIIVDGRAYSHPGVDPRASINYDTAKVACEAKGKGWHIMSNAEWAALALWCKKNDCMPHGNNNYSKSVENPDERGIVSYRYDVAKTAGRTATGSGPASWYHNGDISGIADLNGNVWEWCSGMRLVDGEIQIIPDNDSAACVNESSNSTLWKAIKPDGSLVAPGTAGTLKYDYTVEPGTENVGKGVPQIVTSLSHKQTNENPYAAGTFESMTAASGVTIPEIMQILALAPSGTATNCGDNIYMRNMGERLPFRGGSWHSTSRAGVFALYLYSPRSLSNHLYGFRSAFVDL